MISYKKFNDYVLAIIFLISLFVSSRSFHKFFIVDGIIETSFFSFYWAGVFLFSGLFLMNYAPMIYQDFKKYLFFLVVSLFALVSSFWSAIPLSSFVGALSLVGCQLLVGNLFLRFKEKTIISIFLLLA